MSLKINGPSQAALSATYVGRGTLPPRYADAYAGFFTGPWQTGQGNTSTTLTSAAAQGATTLAVASGASFPNGTILVTNAGTANQKQHTVTGGGGTTSLTISPALPVALANGAAIDPLWTNSTHLTGPGQAAFYYWLVNTSGVFTSTPGNVVLLGNSWGLGTAFATALTARFPSATVTNASVSGNTSAMLLSRFSTDVTGTPSHVLILEPGVNDILTAVDLPSVVSNVSRLIEATQAKGAVPIITGMVPLSDYPTTSATRAVQLRDLITAYPAVPPSVTRGMWLQPDTTNTAIGTVAQGRVTGTANTAIGNAAQRVLTSGSTNTAIGGNAQNALTTANANTAVGHTAQNALTIGANNTAIGQGAQLSLTTGNNNTAIGQAAQLVATTGSNNVAIGPYAVGSLTTGSDNTAIGNKAGYTANGVTANASTSGDRQTFIGSQTGQTAATAQSYNTAVGYAATSATFSVALGAYAKAANDGAVALGTDNGGTGAQTSANNQIALGTANHQIKISNNTTGAGSAALGANCPATTATAPYTWFKMTSSDGSTVYVPAWK